MTYRCPIDGAELKDGQPCKEHGVAISDESLNRQVSRTLGVATPIATDKPAPKRRRGKAHD